MIEIRAYNLKPETRETFHVLMSGRAVPMLKRWNVDVVAYGPSRHDDTSYYLIRRYTDLADREQSQDAFYGSDEWLNGPREAILTLIDSYTSVVLDLDDALVNAIGSELSERNE